MKAICTISLCILILIPSIQAACFNQNQTFKNNPSPIALLDGGWVEQQEDLTILHVNGSHYQMGFQHGYLLRTEVQENIRAFIHYAEQYLTVPDLLMLWNTSQPYIPAQYIQEIQGIADGANISFDDIAAAITAVEYSDHGCFGIAAWGPATTDGTLYHARSFDLPSNIKDPVSKKFVHENTVLIVRNPLNGSASISPSVAGSFHTGGGMNSHGVCLGIQICWSKDQTFEGNLYHFRVQEVLDSATTAEEAIQILNTNRTHGFNFVVSQADPACGFVLEQTANLTYIGTHNDSVESTPPFWAIKHVARRTNVFIDPTIAETQRKRYDPTGLIGFLNLLFFQKSCPFFAVYQLYKSVSKSINSSWGALTLNETMDVLQNGYRAKGFPLLQVIKFFGRGTGMAEAWNQWVACGKTGDMVVSFATHEHLAFQTEPTYVNFYELLSAVPP
ncbi:MAG: hypothetical protein JW840_11110 [Candidatus Thermoplasmatota archaeon]|nr:hypothetical protein [Candidatus Thermoplasmatota archaeon]